MNTMNRRHCSLRRENGTSWRLHSESWETDQAYAMGLMTMIPEVIIKIGNHFHNHHHSIIIVMIIIIVIIIIIIVIIITIVIITNIIDYSSLNYHRD